MAHYNNLMKREALVNKMPDIFNRTPSKVLSFINLCIYPQDFSVLYHSVRTQERLSMPTYEALKGALIGLIVLSKRKHRDTILSVDNYIIDFISFIRNDSVGDPVKFLLSMKAYMLRFMFAKGLQVAFGLDWRKLILESLDLRSAPNPKSYHSLFTNIYIRNLLRVYVIWKNYRDIHEEEYEAGVNDINTLLDKAASHKTSLSREQLVALFETLKENLPSWRYATRKQAAYAIDTCQDGWAIVNRQFSDFRYKQTQG